MRPHSRYNRLRGGTYLGGRQEVDPRLPPRPGMNLLYYLVNTLLIFLNGFLLYNDGFFHRGVDLEGQGSLVCYGQGVRKLHWPRICANHN